eukprot:6027795-Prymnesium_polylepis.1
MAWDGVGMASGWLEMARDVNVMVRAICNRCDTFRNRPPHLPRRTNKAGDVRNIHDCTYGACRSLRVQFWSSWACVAVAVGSSWSIGDDFPPSVKYRTSVKGNPAYNRNYTPGRSTRRSSTGARRS